MVVLLSSFQSTHCLFTLYAYVVINASRFSHKHVDNSKSPIFSLQFPPFFRRKLPEFHVLNPGNDSLSLDIMLHRHMESGNVPPLDIKIEMNVDHFRIKNLRMETTRGFLTNEVLLLFTILVSASVKHRLRPCPEVV